MESEKVKEIKRALKSKGGSFCWIKTTEYECRMKPCYFADILTLINELEETNKKLKQSNKNILFVNEQVIKQNEELKARNAELEKENAKLLDSVETVQSNRCVYKCVLTKEHLKQFAEKLKEQVYDSFGDKVIWYNDIDETLKEFIGDIVF